MRAKAFLFFVGCVPLFVACSFLLDFKELQAGHKGAPDAGPDAGNSETGAGGESGGVDEPGAAGS